MCQMKNLFLLRLESMKSAGCADGVHALVPLGDSPHENSGLSHKFPPACCQPSRFTASFPKRY
jgi:hypothetical protein